MPATDPLITKRELAVWARRDVAEVEQDAFADEVIDGVSELVRYHGDDTWTANTLPTRARFIVKINAANYYNNPDQLIAEGISGGPSERRADHVVRGMTLSDEEKTVLADLADRPTPEEQAGGTLFVIPLGRGERQPAHVIHHVPDDSGSDWWFPFYTSEDPGGLDL